ncbi:MAG: hypothetical protein JWP80_365 [Pseudomonas sp.]|nr:hypothetical protein [Pseudomonas sp.]
MNISLLELRHIIESSFLPLECRCSVNIDRELTVEVVNPASGANVVMGGFSVASLDSSRAIAALIAEVRSELALSGSGPRRGQRAYADF